MAASIENAVRHVTRDDLFGLNTTMIIPLNAYILKMIGKLDSMDVNFSSVNPINLLLTLNKTKPEIIHFNRFFEAPAPIWFQFHSTVKLLAIFIILCLVLYAILMAIVICERIWHCWRNLLRMSEKEKMIKAKFHTIAESVQQIRKLQTIRAGTESEQILFIQIWNDLRCKYQPNRGKKIEALFPNDFNDKNVPKNIKPQYL
ncbi:putative integral membrane protein [Acanthocheilonema viteae]